MARKKLRIEINKLETTTKYVDSMKHGWLRKIRKIDKPLANLTKRQKRCKLIKLKAKRWTSTTDTNEIQRIIRTYFVLHLTGKLKRKWTILLIYMTCQS